MNRKQWLASTLLTALALSVLSGCQPIFVTREVYLDAHSPSLLPAAIEEDHSKIKDPLIGQMPEPPTVDKPDRPARYLTLQEAIAIALENGNASGRAGAGRGLVDDTQAQFTNAGSLNSQTERLRVLALNPAFSNAAMEAAAAKFDPLFVTTASWNNVDGVQTGIFSQTNGQTAVMGSGIIKPLAGGGTASMGFITNYTNLTSPPFGAFTVLNPLYSARLSFGLEQPLLKDWGVDINQLTNRFPILTGNSLPGAGAFTNATSQRQNGITSFVDRGTEGILISRLRFDQSRAEFERSVQVLLLNTEVAYWTLYNKYGQLYSTESNLRLIHRTWQESYNRRNAGKDQPQDYYNVLGQYHEFRGERIRSLAEVLEAERQLRGILGLPGEDGTRLIPITPPNLSKVKPDWDASLKEALETRPELVLSRDNLRFHQYQLSIQQNNLRPDLRAFMKYEPVGYGNAIQPNGTYVDGTGTTRVGNAFQSLAQGQFADWQIGVNLIVPLGFRLEHAAVRGARLQLTQSYYFLRDQEEKTSRVVQQQFQEIASWYARISAARDERIGYQKTLEVRFTLAVAGTKSFGDPALGLLDAQRRYAAALIKEYNAIAEYNNAMARFEWSKGATLRYNNVHISEGPLPQAVQVRAVEYEKERSKAFTLLYRPDSLQQPGRHVVNKTSDLPVIEAPAELIQSRIAPELPAPKTLPDIEDKVVPEKVKTLPKVEENIVPDKVQTLPKVEEKVAPEKAQTLLPKLEANLGVEKPLPTARPEVRTPLLNRVVSFLKRDSGNAPAQASPLPKVIDAELPDKILPVPPLESIDLPRKPMAAARILDKRWAPLPQKNTDQSIDFRSSPAIVPSNDVARSAVDTPSPGMPLVPIGNVAPREMIFAPSPPPAIVNNESAPTPNRQTLEFPSGAR